MEFLTKDISDYSALELLILLGLSKSGYLTTNLWCVRYSKATLVLKSLVNYGA